MMRRLLLILFILPAAACTSTNIAELAKALATDTATVCGHNRVVTPWGTGEAQLARTNITNGTVTFTADGGCVVTSGTATTTSTAPAK